MTTVFSIALVSYITLMYPLTLGGHVIGLITAGAFLVILTHFVAERLAADLAKLPAQLGAFSIRDTKCTCCQMNHIDPDSGEPMVCDRVLVYATLATWFAPPVMAQHVKSIGIHSTNLSRLICGLSS